MTEYQEAIFTDGDEEHVPKKHVTSIIKQLETGQDFALFGTSIDYSSKQFDYLMTFDGHGLDTCISSIKKLPLHEIVKSESPIEELNVYLYATFKNFKNSGSTCILTKIYSDHIIIEYVGDSQIVVFIDNKCHYISVPHNLENPEESERIKPYLCKETPITFDKKPAMVSNNRLAMVEGNRCNLPSGSRLNLSQALGHNGGTGFQPTRKRLDFIPEQHVRIISASDGFWDMIFLDDEKEMKDLMELAPEELISKAEKRWKQEWIFSEDRNETDESKIFTTSFDGQIDDISLAFWDNKYIS